MECIVRGQEQLNERGVDLNQESIKDLIKHSSDVLGKQNQGVATSFQSL